MILERVNLLEMNGKKAKKLFLLMTVMLMAGSFVGEQSTVYAEKAPKLVLSADSITVIGCKKLNEKEIRRLLPELNNKEVRIGRLSKQIQLVKDSKAVDINTDFRIIGDNKYAVTVKVDEKKTDHVVVSTSNTGNEYTGKWRTNIGFSSSDISGRADTLGIFYVTSPSVKYHDDVRQAAIYYKTLFPNSGDTAYVSYSYSDVDMGTIGRAGALTLQATGKGTSWSTHYQRNFEYTSAHKKILDMGFDIKKYDNDHIYTLGGLDVSFLNKGQHFNTNTYSFTYIQADQWDNNFLSFTLGYTGNFHGDEEKFDNYRTGSDTNFHYYTASLNYQKVFKNNWILGADINGQFTRCNLLYSEQMGAGGANSVRGFNDRVCIADNGYKASLELYTPPIGKNQRIVFFTDFARLINNQPNFGELDNENIASIGIGYRMFGLNGWNVNIDYGHIIDDIEGRSSGYKLPWHVSVSKSF